MKLIKINTDHYVIVDESIDMFTEPIGSYYLHIEDEYVGINCITKDTILASYYKQIYFKITHSTIPKGMMLMEGIERLSLQEVKELIGEVDVEKKIYALCQSECIVDDYGKATDDGMVIGIRAYNQALEDNKEKKYTEKDINKTISWAINSGRTGKVTITDIDNFIQSLQPKTEWEVEIVDGKLKLRKRRVGSFNS